MGLSIGYTLQFDGSDAVAVRRLVERLRAKATELPFAEVGEIFDLRDPDCDFDQNSDPRMGWLLVQAQRYLERGESYVSVSPTRLIAFTTWPGDGSEAANFGLCTYPAIIEHEGEMIPTELTGWSWQSCCKTQYASNPERGGLEHFLRCHLTIVDLLDFAVTLGIVKQVHDDSKYWDTRSVEELSKTIARWNSMIAAFAGKLKDKLGDGLTAEITSYPNFEHLEADGRKRDPSDG